MVRLLTGTAEIGSVDGFLDELRAIETATACTVQAFDARYVASPEHLRRAVTLADRAIEREEAIARDRGIEITLYAAGRRQIDDALEIGVSEGTNAVAVVVAAEPASARGEPDPGTAEQSDPDTAEQGATADEQVAATNEQVATADEQTAAERVASLLTDTRHVDPETDELRASEPERIRSYFGITDRELGATDASLAALVIERVALLTVEK